MTPGSRRPTLTLGLPTFGTIPGGDWRRLLDIARAADDAGIDRVTVTDHVVNGPNVEAYPWGRFPVGPDADWLEPLTVLTALAALGVDHAARGRILTDTIAACRALWGDLPATFSSSTVSFSDTYCAPRPVQPRVPVWFSGTLTERNLRRIMELGDGWIPIMGSTVDDIRRGADRLQEAFAAAGRSSDELAVQGALAPVRDGQGRSDPTATMAAGRALLDAGATDLSIHLRVFDPGLDDPAAACVALVKAFDRVA